MWRVFHAGVERAEGSDVVHEQGDVKKTGGDGLPGRKFVHADTVGVHRHARRGGHLVHGGRRRRRPVVMTTGGRRHVPTDTVISGQRPVFSGLLLSGQSTVCALAAVLGEATVPVVGVDGHDLLWFVVVTRFWFCSCLPATWSTGPTGICSSFASFGNRNSSL